jgi:hypothetical protein
MAASDGRTVQRTSLTLSLHSHFLRPGKLAPDVFLGRDSRPLRLIVDDRCFDLLLGLKQRGARDTASLVRGSERVFEPLDYFAVLDFCLFRHWSYPLLEKFRTARPDVKPPD